MHMSWSELNPIVTHANLLQCTGGQQFGPRWISEHQFIYVVHGKGEARIGNQLYEASAGDLFYYGPQVPHQFRAGETDPFTLYGIHFSLSGDLPKHKLMVTVHVRDFPQYPEEFSEYELLIGSPEKRMTVAERAIECSWAESFFSEITAYFERSNEISFQHNRAQMLLFFIRLREHLVPEATKQDKVMKYVKTELVNHAEMTYDRAWLKEWTHYHEDHASRLFAKTYGISPHQYHTRQKIQRAKQYLMSTDLTIVEITDKIEMGSIHYFSRMFKQHTGLSPTDYRKRSRII